MSEKASTTALAYRPEIDGLRALAVIVVILYHVGLGFPGGYVGVDVFFVISGFLITSLLLKDLDRGTFTLSGFYERRARRILPASLVVTAAVLAVGYFRLLPLDLEELGYSAVAHVVGGANFFAWSRLSDYFGADAASMPLLHMWSLAVEEQFYVLFPLLLWVCYRFERFRSRRAMAVPLSVLMALSLGWSAYGVYKSSSAAFFMLPTRAWELMAGAMLAVVPAWRTASQRVREVAAILGLAAILVPVFLYTGQTPFPGVAAIPPCVGAAIFIWACRRPRDDESTDAFRLPLVGRLFASPVPVFMGAISYSLYLVHWPVIVLGKYWMLSPLTTTQRLAMVGASFVLAVLSYYLVEQPFRRRALSPTRRSMFLTSAGAMAVVFAVGLVFKLNDGLRGRYPLAINELDNVRRFKTRFRQVHVADVINDRLTPFGDESAPVSLLVWGDSHAAAAMPALDQLCKDRGIGARAAAHSSTPPLVDYFINSTLGLGDETVAFNRAVIDYVARHKIKTVVLASFWERDTDHDPEKLDLALGRTIEALHNAGATTYVFMQVPSYSIEVPKALAYEAIQQRESVRWRKSLPEHEAGRAEMYRLAKKYESDHCVFVDPAPAFLPRKEKYLIVASRGRSLYSDSNHLTVWASRRMLAPVFEKTVFADPNLTTATTDLQDTRRN